MKKFIKLKHLDESTYIINVDHIIWVGEQSPSGYFKVKMIDGIYYNIEGSYFKKVNKLLCELEDDADDSIEENDIRPVITNPTQRLEP